MMMKDIIIIFYLFLQKKIGAELHIYDNKAQMCITGGWRVMLHRAKTKQRCFALKIRMVICK